MDELKAENEISDKFTNTNGTLKNPCMKRRTAYLEEEINLQMERINNEENEELFEITYLFYDGFNYNGV